MFSMSQIARYRIQTMEHASYLRLREVMKLLNIELSDAELARKFNLIDQHIQNWKKRGVPKDYLIDLADEWGFRIKYVKDGDGLIFKKSPIYPNSPEAKVLSAMQHMDEATKYQVVKISNTLAEPEETNGKHNTQ